MIKNKVVCLLSSMLALTLFTSANNSNTVSYQKNDILTKTNQTAKSDLKEFKNVLWENGGRYSKVVWDSSVYRFGIIGHVDPYDTDIYQFPTEQWDIFKKETFYVDFSFDNINNPDIYIQDGKWMHQIRFVKQDFIQNPDNTLTLKVNLSNDSIVSVLDSNGLVFMPIGSPGAVERIYTKKYYINNNKKQSDVKQNNGYLELNKTLSKDGEICLITVNPQEGFGLKENSLKVTYGDPEQTCVLTQPDPSKDWIYSFVMPDADVTISAEFIQKATPIPPQPSSGISGGPLIGIVLGSEVGVAIILILFTFVFSKPKK